MALYFTVSFTNTDTFCVVVTFSNSITVSKTVTCDGARRGTPLPRRPHGY